MRRGYFVEARNGLTVIPVGSTPRVSFQSRTTKTTRLHDASPLFMLHSLDALGRAERLAGTELGGDVVMPAIRVKDFNFTSWSDAV